MLGLHENLPILGSKAAPGGISLAERAITLPGVGAEAVIVKLTQSPTVVVWLVGTARLGG